MCMGNSVHLNINRTAEHLNSWAFHSSRAPSDREDLKCFKWGNIGLNGTELLEVLCQPWREYVQWTLTMLLGWEAITVIQRTSFNKSIMWGNCMFGMHNSCTVGYQIGFFLLLTAHHCWRTGNALSSSSLACLSPNVCTVLELYSFETWVS